jgi:hypothetical protein
MQQHRISATDHDKPSKRSEAPALLIAMRLRVLRVFGRMVFRSFVGVVFRLDVVAVCYMSVMTGLLVLSRIVVGCSSQVVLGGLFVVMRCLAMVFGGFFRHRNFPSS